TALIRPTTADLASRKRKNTKTVRTTRGMKTAAPPTPAPPTPAPTADSPMPVPLMPGYPLRTPETLLETSQQDSLMQDTPTVSTAQERRPATSGRWEFEAGVVRLQKARTDSSPSYFL